MLVGSTENSFLTKSYPIVVQNLLEYISSIEHKNLPLGRHEIPGFDPKLAWFVLLEYEKEALENFNPEVHKNYSDLQIILEGTEMMAWSIDTGNHQPSEPYLEQRDLQYYKFEGIELNFFKAVVNQFYLFTPNIVHVTNITDGNEAKVRKLVVKIHNDLLDAK